jgi:hypothetical protein
VGESERIRAGYDANIDEARIRLARARNDAVDLKQRLDIARNDERLAAEKAH